MDAIPQMEPWFDESERQAVDEYLRSGGWVTEFDRTREFEARLAEYVGARHCSVVSSGTAALFVALAAQGLTWGDEVVVPDYTMVATANAVRLAGAEVVFADISPESLCIDFDCLRAAVTRRTRAVILVSINGRYPVDLEEMIGFCRERGIAVIEDAAQSLGSCKSHRHLGTFGDIGCFSFSAPKIITTGQGGAVVTDAAEVIERVRKIRDFGREKPGADRYVTMGWNFKFTDLQAVIGLEQMKKLPWRVERKKAIFERYRNALTGTPGVGFVPTNLAETSPWFIDILIADRRRDAVMEALKREGIGSRPFYPALHAEPAYARRGSYPVADRIAQEGLWLPSSSRLTDEQIDRVSTALQRVLAGRAATAFRE